MKKNNKVSNSLKNTKTGSTAGKAVRKNTIKKGQVPPVIVTTSISKKKKIRK